MCEHGHVNRVVENGKGKEDGKRFKVETRDFFFFFFLYFYSFSWQSWKPCGIYFSLGEGELVLCQILRSHWEDNILGRVGGGKKVILWCLGQ